MFHLHWRRLVVLACVLGAAGGLIHRQRPSLPQLLARLDPMQGYQIEEGQVVLAGAPPQGDSKVDALDLGKAYQRAAELAARTKGKVFKSTLTPHWFADNTRFWYRNDLKDGAKEFIVVDAARGTRRRPARAASARTWQTWCSRRSTRFTAPSRGAVSARTLRKPTVRAT